MTDNTENLDQQFDEAIQDLRQFYTGANQDANVAELLILLIHDTADDGTLKRLTAEIHKHLVAIRSIQNHTA